MADQKISELTALTGANVADDDAIAIVDTSATETKKIVFSELKNALDTATGFVRITGDTMTGNLSMGDNVKAIFGAGSDLQIYHDGSNSYIDDTGSGSLVLKGSAYTIIRDAGGFNMALFEAGGASTLYHNSVSKLATTATGVDITGTLTSDGLTVDGDASIQNTGNSYRTLSIGANRSASVNTLGRLDYDWDGTPVARIHAISGTDATNKDNGDLVLSTSEDGTLKQRIFIDQGGDISFYEDTGTTAKLVWDASAEMLTTSGLTVEGDARFTGTVSTLNYPNSLLLDYFSTVTGTRIFSIGPDSSTEGQFEFHTSTTTANKKRLSIATGGDISFYEDTGSTAKLTWDASAEMLTTSGLTVESTATTRPTIGNSDVNTSGLTTGLNFKPISNLSDGAKLNIISGFQPTATSAYTAGFEFVTQDHAGGGSFAQTKALSIGAGGDISFYEDTGTTPKFFWDASAESLGIGTSSPDDILHLYKSSNPKIILETQFSGSARGSSITSNANTMELNAGDTSVAAGGTSNLVFKIDSTERMRIDSSGNVGIGTDSPNDKVDISGSTGDGYRLTDGTHTGVFRSISGGTILKTTTNHALIFGSNDTERMRIDSSGNVGIGTSSPTSKLDIRNTGGTNSDGIRLQTVSAGNIAAIWTSVYDLNIGISGSHVFTNFDGTTERMRIDSSGRVGIGTSSPDYQVQIENSGEANLSIKSGVSNYAQILLGDGGNATLGRLRYNNADNSFQTVVNGGVATTIDSSGNVGIGETLPKTELNISANNSGQGAKLTIENTDTSITSGDILGQIDFYANDGSTNGTGAKANIRSVVESSAGTLIGLAFGTSNSASATAVEAMRIDSSGNLLVGKTSASFSTAGHELRAGAAAIFVRDGNDCLSLNRLTSDGDIAKFSKDGTTVGSIGTRLGRLKVGYSDVGLFFDNTNDRINPEGPDNTGSRDAAIDLGHSSGRFKDLYLSGGVYLGGTGSANKLDDYEEGTWTPTLSASTTAPTVSSYDTQIGQYTKVGDTVTFIAVIRATLSAAGSGSPRVTGLPFAATTSLPAAYLGLRNILSGTPTPYISSTRVQIDGTSYITSSNLYLCVSGTYKA